MRSSVSLNKAVQCFRVSKSHFSGNIESISLLLSLIAGSLKIGNDLVNVNVASSRIGSSYAIVYFFLAIRNCKRMHVENIQASLFFVSEISFDTA